MKKKIITLAVALAFLMPGFSVFAEVIESPKPFDFTNGLLDDMNLIQSNNLPSEMFDNSTAANIIYGGSSSKITFAHKVDIEAMFLNTQNYYNDLIITFTGDTVRTYTFEKNKTINEVVPFSAKGVRTIELSSPNNSYVLFYELDFFGSYNTNANYPQINDLLETHDYNSISLSWINPLDVNYKSALIMSNGILIAEIPKKANTYKVTNLESETAYKYDVIASYTDGGKALPVSINVTTDKAPPPPEPAGEVINLTSEVEFNRVDLSWSLPNNTNFKHVNIYRDKKPETALIEKARVSSVAKTKIFETNGTYFNDLTVKPESTYEYTLTTQSTEGLESEGVTEVVTTPEEPAPEIIGGQFEKNPETGDYTYTWTEPTKGKVQVLIGGNLYKTVNAADKNIVIPAKDMKFNVAGIPQVQLIPISESGKEGAPIKPPSNSGGSGGIIDNVKVPFGANDLLGAGTGLLWVVGPFVLLALAFLVVPKLRNMLGQAITGNKNAPESPVRRSNDSPGREYRERGKRVGRINREPRETIYKGRLTRAERRG